MNVSNQKKYIENKKGFSGDVPLIKVKGNLSHIAYSKGAITMYKLCELIGKDKVNEALLNFLNKHKYPAFKPISTDFLDEVYKIKDKKVHQKINKLFNQ